MQKVISKDGTPIAFERSGKGPAVILLSGDTRSSLGSLLTSHFTVFRYDRRGRGESSDTLPYAVQREVEDLDALIQEAGGSVFVFAREASADLALNATVSGLAITKLALYEPPVIVDDNDRQATEGLLAQFKELISSGRPGDAIALFMTVTGSSAEDIAAKRAEPSWAQQEAGAHTMVYDATVVRDTWTDYPLASGRWDTVTLPTLVLNGAESPWWIRDHALPALVSALPNAKQHTLPAPDALASALIEFFIG